MNTKNILWFLLIIIIFFVPVTVKASEPEPGGLLVKLKDNPPPHISIGEELSNESLIPVTLSGSIDVSATHIYSLPALKKTGFAFIAQVMLPETESEYSIEQFYHSLLSAFSKQKSMFYVEIANSPTRIIIDTVDGFKVKENKGRKIVELTMRGSSVGNIFQSLWDLFKQGISRDNIINTIHLALDKDFFTSTEGLKDDRSPGKILTKGLIKPIKTGQLDLNFDFYNYDQCTTKDVWYPCEEIFLKKDAHVSKHLTSSFKSWNSYISPWDFDGVYNTSMAFFEEAGEYKTLPGHFLDYEINWNLRKYGLPTSEMIRQRFGRVVNYFTNTIEFDKKKDILVTEQQVEDGKIFKFEPKNSLLNPNVSKLKLKYSAVAPDIRSFSFDNTKKNLILSVSAKTSKNIKLLVSIDDQGYKEIINKDISEDTKEIEELTAHIDVAGKHLIKFKVVDNLGLESEIKEITSKDVFLKQSTSIDKKEVIEGEEVSLKIDYDAMGRRWEGRNLTVNLEDYSGNQLAYVSNSCMLDGKRMSASSIHIDRKTVKIDLPSMNENTHSQLSLKLKVQKSDTTSTNGKIKCITSVKDESPQVSINPLIISGIPDRITQEVFVDKDNIIQGDTINCTIKQLVHFQESTNRNLEISVKDFLDAGVILKYVPDSLYINDVKITPQSISKDKITVHLSDIKYSNKDTNVTIRLQFKVFQSSTKDVKQQIKFHFNDSEYNRRDDFISMKIRGIYKGDIEAIGNVYNLYLGDTLKEDRPINCIVNKVIKVGENVVDPMDYKLNWEKPLKNISTETIGEKSASIKITYLPTHKEKTIQVPINVHYGNSLLIMDTDKRALGTFRLSDNNIIEAHQGGEINDNEVLEKGNNDKIYEVDWYDFANKHNGYDENIDDISHGEFLVEGLGNDHKLDVLKKWSKCKVSEGDILRVTEKSPEKVFYTKDNQKITINSKRKNVFFEIFNHQYRLLNINNLCSKIPTIKIGTSHQEIDQKINTYTNNQFDNVSIEKIIEYPDTASPGMKKAKIQVSEILSTQKRYWLKTYHQKVHYVMDMEFYVTDGGEIRLSVPDKIEFENLDTIYSKEQIINRKKDKNLGIRVTDTRTKKSSWSIDLQVVKGDLLPYTVWKDENDNYKYLNNPVKIYESSGLDEQEIDISSNWRRNAQLLFRIPKKTYLPTGSYSEILVWNLIQGPN